MNSPLRGLSQHDTERIRRSEDAPFLSIWKQCEPFTMTSFERGLALYRATRYIINNKILGSIVECGVWRGGSVMIVLLTLKALNEHREIFLFDTFEGMTAPGKTDIDYLGRPAESLMREDNEKDPGGVWAIANEANVRDNLASTGYDPSFVHITAGDIRNTLPDVDTGRIALLRLDTDFYDSTKIELERLYPKLNDAGALIIDDYGHWEGSRLATDEYFEERRKAAGTIPYLHRIDYTGRIMIKNDSSAAVSVRIACYDYIPPGLSDPNLLPHFPSLAEQDATKNRWPFLRREVPHVFRTDVRSKVANIGVISKEEAVILHNLAKHFSGLRALEIGCHLAWSSAHILAAGVRLDIVDPRLEDGEHGKFVRDSLTRAVPNAAYKLWSGFSPSIIDAVAATSSEPWSFVFIDGNHDGIAPVNDSIAVIPHCADTACVVFHDLVAPPVAAGLEYFRKQGWNTRIYNTMQVLGIAWRGDFTPIQHIADKNVPEYAVAPGRNP